MKKLNMRAQACRLLIFVRFSKNISHANMIETKIASLNIK